MDSNSATKENIVRHPQHQSFRLYSSSKIAPLNRNGSAWSTERNFRSEKIMAAKVAPSALDPNEKKNGRPDMVLSSHLESENAEGRQSRQQNVMSQTRHPWIFKIYQMMESKYWQITISFLIIYALFGDDLRVALFPPSTDSFFYSMSLIALLAFLMELIVFTMCKPGYYKSFYFALDIIATTTMLTDIGFIWQPLITLMLDGGEGSGQSDALNAIRTSRVGTKSSGIVRIVRLVRLVRVVKLYKATKSDDVEDHVAEENPSLVGKKLSDKTMQRVITVVLSMLIFVQFFSISMYVSSVPQGTYGLYKLHKKTQMHISANKTEFEAFLENDLKTDIQDYTRGIENGELIYLQLHGTEEYSEEILEFAKRTQFYESDGDLVHESSSGYNPSTSIVDSETVSNEFRETEYEAVTHDVCYDSFGNAMEPFTSGNCTSWAYFNIRSKVRLEAALNMLQTVFVMLVLTFGSLLFSNDAETLVIKPIERMVIAVKQLAENPMGSTQLTNTLTSSKPADNDDETVLLQRTIAKIGQLLQIGFGEAGSEIIAKNMSNNSGIEPMCDGVKIEAVFGFCDIRNFTDTTECLQESVMVYVNKVGSIVHEATHSWYGAANKNIGDAFLLVWKVKDSKKQVRDVGQGNMCDNALIAFLKSMIDLKRENGPGGCLHEYKDHAAIRKRFGENNFEIKLGLGLHIGWAIEGTIGSRFKIDASYLSPNVNMASRLEAATKQFRTPLLLSEDFYDALSSKARKRCRQIDKVTVKGSVQPMGLFTCDVVQYPKKFAEVEYLEDGSRKPFDFEGSDMDFIQESLPDNFFAEFKHAVGHYLAGQWDQAKKELEAILVKKPEDGPTVSLLENMGKLDFKAPEDWNGYRELTEK